MGVFRSIAPATKNEPEASEVHLPRDMIPVYRIQTQQLITTLSHNKRFAGFNTSSKFTK